MRYYSTTFLTFIIFATLACGNSRREPVKDGPFAKLKDPNKVPEGLRKAYADFLAFTVNENKSEELFDKLILPNSVRFSTAPRQPEKMWYIKDDVNLDFIRRQFKSEVVSVKKVNDEVYTIRTWTTAFYYINTQSGKWLIYMTYDSPIA